MLTAVTCPRSLITTANSLETSLLQALFNDEICALRISAYVDPDTCHRLAHYFSGHRSRENYTHEIRNANHVVHLNYGVDRVGVAYNTTYGKGHHSPEWKRNYAEALPNMCSLRQACQPLTSPIDRLRLELDELWPAGANVAAFEGHKMFAGIGRLTEAQHSGILAEQPHFDSVPNHIANLTGRYAANFYLQLPAAGGELEIWDVPPLPISAIDNAPLDADWREQLPDSILLKPALGDLIIFNTRRPHAVRNFQHGSRISLQTFIGRCQNQSLALWN